MALQRLKEAAERAKCELSTAAEATVNLPFISADESGPRHLSRVLTRPHFESLVGELVARTEGPCRDALEQAELAPEEIDEARFFSRSKIYLPNWAQRECCYSLIGN